MIYRIRRWFKNKIKKKKIRKQINALLCTTVNLKKKNIDLVTDLKKTDLDSVELMTLLIEIEKVYGAMDLAVLYQMSSFDDLVNYIAAKTDP